MNSMKQSVPDKRQVLVTTEGRVNGCAHEGINPIIVRMAESQAEHRASHRHAMVAEAAYLRSERRGFAPGHELEDWLNAELEVEAEQRLSTLCPSDSVTPAEQANWAVN